MGRFIAAVQAADRHVVGTGQEQYSSHKKDFDELSRVAQEAK
jgi:hypothetical protein